MKIDWFTFVAQIINFLVLVYLLKRFLYAPITNAMQARESGITSRIEQAKRKEADADRMTEEYRLRSEQLERERLRMFEEAKTEVDASRQQQLTQARADVKNRREDWLASLSREKATLSQIVRQRCGQQVAAATRQAIRQLADADLEEQMLRAFIQKLSAEGSLTTNRTRFATNGNAIAVAYTAFDVSPIWRDRLKSALTQQIELTDVEFRVMPEIVCGVEIHIGSEKIGWSVEEYLATLEEEFHRLVEQPTP